MVELSKSFYNVLYVLKICSIQLSEVVLIWLYKSCTGVDFAK